MKEFEIKKNESGQRFDKYLKKLLKEAPDSFIYKMLRKKNIVLNEKRADGREILNIGDNVRLFFSDETFLKFSGSGSTDMTKQYIKAYSELSNLKVVYEDEDILVVNKPAGVLTQKANQDDISVNEWLIGYMLSKGETDASVLATFKPSVCNRLDRNTSGMVACGKTLSGSRYLGQIIKDKTLRKYYYCIVDGDVDIDCRLSGYLSKDTSTNKVTIYNSEDEIPKDVAADYIDTRFETVGKYKRVTLLEVELFTGKTHQIRAHLSSIGHPIIGDIKYGNKNVNRKYNSYGASCQLLHAHKLVFPSGMVLECGMPEIFTRLLETED